MVKFEDIVKRCKLSDEEIPDKVATNVNNTKEYLLHKLTQCINTLAEENVNEEDFDIEFYDFPSLGEELFDKNQIKGVKLSYKGEELDIWKVVFTFSQVPDLEGSLYYWDEDLEFNMYQYGDSEEEVRKMFWELSQNNIENCAFLI